MVETSKGSIAVSPGGAMYHLAVYECLQSATSQSTANWQPTLSNLDMRSRIQLEVRRHELMSVNLLTNSLSRLHLSSTYLPRWQ